jgi:quercetin dioxygenase-like cupin family protein
MYCQTVARQSLKMVLMSGLLLAGASAGAPLSAQEPPVTWTAKDSKLKWGPCPEFLPKGCRIAVLHGDPAKNNADIFLRVPANSTLPRHWHTSPERMVLVSGELQVTYDGQKTAVLKPGTYAYGPAKLPHKGECTKAGPCVLFIAFEAPVDAVPSEGEPKK